MRLSGSVLLIAVLSLLCVITTNEKCWAQCGEVVVAEIPVECCGGLSTQPDYRCGGHGSCSYACFEGFGTCCGATYHSANTAFDSDCASGLQLCGEDGGRFDNATCSCRFISPILIDISGNGFHLTGAGGGVQFQFDPARPKLATGWTTPGSDGDAFLVLDRNNNGTIDNGTELFGNFTPQPASENPNGFLALAVYDQPENGGNADGLIDHHDRFFSSLRLWVDANHDGISQAEELHTLQELAVFSLSLHYRESQRQDRFGNKFRYLAAVNPSPVDGQSKEGRWAYDVFFVGGSERSASRLGRSFTSPQCPGSMHKVVQPPQSLRPILSDIKLK